ncbi:MAG: zinc-binding dehydrogenase [Streptosporangiaceae bacterium]|nr:zinc-binding dehydrogenase [Streptosporangiaceae bacterium]
MRAVVLKDFGAPDNLVAEDVADPEPGPGQVLIDVEIANITFVETQIRAGRAPNPAMAPRLPAILGNGVGGVDATTGQRVITTTGGSGGYAQRAVVDSSWTIPVPAGLALEDAVALLADGRTATALLRATMPRPGETVLVEAAAGGVGSLLVQLARNAGARVIAAAGGPRKMALAREIGADQAVDYTESGWAAQAGAVDVVYDGVGGEIARDAFGLLRDGGRMIMYGAAGGAFAAIADADAVRRGTSLIRGAQVSPEQMRELTMSALGEAAAQRLRPVICQTFPLERAADAHRAIERRETVGKTLLISGGS